MTYIIVQRNTKLRKFIGNVDQTNQKEQTKQSERHTFLIYYFYLRPLLYFLFKYPQLP